jgi:glucose/arabinose dehydrogenase
LQPVEGTFQLPLYVTYAGDGSGRIFVVEKEGTVSIVRQNRRQSSFFLDIRDRVGASASEQGLLSIAFHPDYAENGQFFVNYTDTNGDTVVARYHVSSNPDVADAASEEVILTIEQPAANHNGGLVLFGPDGYLYIGMGDGGAAGDPWGNAQDRSVLLGNMLRLDVDQGSPYAIPPDNPFVDQANMRPEIWAWGLRNPWRFSFDRATNDLYIGDVGQNMYEEVHYQPASSDGGENYGWNRMEGAACYPEDGSCETQGLEMPVAVYSHQDGHCSITGGYVYRGIASPELQGVYFFADYCSGYLWALRQVNGNWNSRLVQQTGMSISSFGEDESGELYLTDMWEGKVYRLSSR